MLTDADRALLILKEYRYAVAENTAVQAINDAAGEVEIQTSLSEADATALANKIAAANEHPRLFDMTVEGILWLDFFKGGPPQWNTVLPHDALNEPMKGISTRISFGEGTSRIEVRG